MTSSRAAASHPAVDEWVRASDAQAFRLCDVCSTRHAKVLEEIGFEIVGHLPVQAAS